MQSKSKEKWWETREKLREKMGMGEMLCYAHGGVRVKKKKKKKKKEKEIAHSLDV